MRLATVSGARAAIASALFFAACSSSDPGADTPPLPAAPAADAGATESGSQAPPPCTGKAGTFHDQPFEAGGETRHYWLYVPASYDCTKGAALLVDFHGTGFGSLTDAVEESWATPELVAAADAEGFIVLRPRSRSKPAPGGTGNYFQWDINPGDVAKNKEFATALVADLRTKYHVPDARMYASGFSNGPSMAAQFLGDEPSLFKGFGLVAGGLNAPLDREKPFAADAPRVYSMTGFRDYMLLAKDMLDAFLKKHGYPEERRFDRETDTGHEIYGWHFREAFAWMDRGQRPTHGSVKAPWARESAGTESFVEVTTSPAGELVAVGAKGGIHVRDTNGTWSQKASLPTLAPLTDVCFLSDGRGFAVGHGKLAGTKDGTTWNVLPNIPEFGQGQQFGYTYATSIACSGSRVTAGGVWSSATSIDGGKTWTAASTESEGAAVFVSAVRATEAGWLSFGYWNYAGHSTDGTTFAPAALEGQTQWWNDGAAPSASTVVAVGEGGVIQRSADQGVTFGPVVSATKEDLYAVTFRGQRGVAVGAHGTAIVTLDGGVTWSDRSTGIDGYLGGARFLDDATVIVVGEGGTVLRLSLLE